MPTSCQDFVQDIDTLWPVFYDAIEGKGAQDLEFEYIILESKIGSDDFGNGGGIGMYLYSAPAEMILQPSIQSEELTGQPQPSKSQFYTNHTPPIQGL